MDAKRETLVVVVGATGSGKTDLAVELACRLGGPIISTDSRQVFAGMAIGTAQPTAAQLAAVRHYFIADRQPSDDYTAGRFAREATELLDELFRTHDYVVAVGGSGLYVDALCEGFDDLPLADRRVRTHLAERLTAAGLDDLLAELRRLDPEYYDVVDRRNPVRVMRALEVCLVSGKPYSAQRRGRVAERPFRIVKIGIDIPREELYARIDSRVDAMVAAGLETEARELYNLRHLNALRTVGYREIFDWIDGKTSFVEAVELIKRNTRHYAKRQLTWFRRDEAILWSDKKDVDSIEKYVKKFGG